MTVTQSETYWKAIIVWSNITFGMGEHSGLEEKSQDLQKSLSNQKISVGQRSKFIQLEPVVRSALGNRDSRSHEFLLKRFCPRKFVEQW